MPSFRLLLWLTAALLTGLDISLLLQPLASEFGWLVALSELRLTHWLVVAALMIWAASFAQPAKIDPPHPEKYSLSRSLLDLSLIALCTIWSCLLVAMPLGTTPPAYHDEYSYLLQAWTFLQGRTSLPGPENLPRLFDQMHVLNEGLFASRYFPGVGLWLAPFLGLGVPVWGQYLAHFLTAGFLYATGLHLQGRIAGLVAGLSLACCPALALFSNLYLSHSATLVGLSMFVWTYFRWEKTGDLRWGLCSGIGLMFAMLCRPLTAAGFALPFGLKILAKLITPPYKFRTKIQTLIAFGAPLALGLLLMGAYNRSITGSLWRTPYQEYTEIYTPRHIYGFDNLPRGEKIQGERTLRSVSRNYDSWASNVTPASGLKTVAVRFWASWRFTFGVSALGAVLLCALFSSPTSEKKLLLLSLASLHLVYWPYWYAGIMDWHYVFETLILWCLLVGLSIGTFSPRARWGYLALIVASTGTAWGLVWNQEIPNLLFAKNRYAAFQTLIDQEVTDLPALVLVIPDPSDRHLDYVTNSPLPRGRNSNSAGFDRPIIFARLDSESPKLDEIARSFPDRSLYLFDAKSGALSRSKQSTKRPR